MVVKLDNWKDINQVGSAEKVHRQNVEVREQGKTLDEKLRHAYENYRGKKKASPTESRKGKGEVKQPQPKAASLTTQTKSTQTVTHQTPAPQAGSEPVKKTPTTLDPQPNVYRTPTSAPSNTTNNPQVRAASQFVIGNDKPGLANLLLRGNTPPTPPSVKETKQFQPSHLSDVVQQAQQSVAPKVQAPVASDAGGKLADATHRQTDGEVGKKKKEGKETKSSEGRGKAVAAQNSRLMPDDSRLEAASSGVASDSGEPVWIADLASIGYTVNPASKLDENRDAVRERAEKFRKYVERPKVAEVMARGVELSAALDELFDQVKKNIPPKNSYGVVRG